MQLAKAKGYRGKKERRFSNMILKAIHVLVYTENTKQFL